jgi:hypothetical protein
MVKCLYPNVCKAPDKPAPFDSIALFGAGVGHSSNVRFNSFMAMHEQSRIPCVLGDEPGKGGGVKSKVRGGYCRPVADLANKVQVNGQPVVRHDTLFEMNCAGPEGLGNTQGKCVYFGSDAGASVAPDSSIKNDTAPPVQPARWYRPPKLTPEQAARLGRHAGSYELGRQVIGFGRGLTLSVAGALEGMYTVGKGVAVLLYDLNTLSPVPIGPKGSYAESLQRTGETVDYLKDVATYVTPGDVWSAMTEEIVAAWQSGEYGEAGGRVFGEFLDFWAGAKGAGKIGKGSKLAKVGGGVVTKTDEAKGAADKLEKLGQKGAAMNEIAQETQALAQVVDAARQNGTLEALLDSGKLTPDQIERLRKARKLTRAEAARAHAAYERKKKEDDNRWEGTYIRRRPF